MLKPTSTLKKINNWIAEQYGDKPANMLIHTGIIGWALSSLAQTAAILTNEKIPTEQKMYLIPQELSDAGVNIASFYVMENGNLTPELADSFKSFKTGMDVIATTVGSILSCNIITPIIRNEIATHNQRYSISKYKKNTPELNYLAKPTLQSFQAQSYRNPDLKV